MINDYTCPRCHNVFPSINKMLHERICTEENPVPLNASRLVIPKETELKQDEQNNNQVNNENNQENKEVIPPIPEFVQNSNNLNKNKMNEVYNFEEIPKQYLCEICNKMIEEKDKADHILCHDLEKEQENEVNNNGNNNNDIYDIFGFSEREIAEQRKMERQFERNKNKRLNRNIRENNNNNNNNNYNNRINNLRNVINSYSRLDRNNNNNIPNNANNRRNVNNNNNNNNNNHHNYQNNRNNQVSNGPVVTISAGQNGNRIITRVYPNYNEVVDIQQQQNLNFLPRLNRRNNHNLNNAFIDYGSSLRRGNNISERFNFFFEEMMDNIHHHPRPTDKQLFNEFPETKIEDINKLDPEKRNCVICLEDFKSGEKATLLPCVHLFHKNCIKNWLKSKNSCPICKFELTRENINKQNNKYN